MKNQISILLHIACLAILTRAQATETKTPIETCNVPYLTMSAGEIKATLTAVFQGKVDRGIKDANIIIEKYIPLIEHDVQFVRVCESCKSQNLSGYGCEKKDYGYDVTHSGLVLFPVDYDANDKASTSIINTDKLKTWFHFKPVTWTQKGALSTVYEPGFETWEYAVLTASFGYVSIVPDKSGYGTSSSLVNVDMVRKGLFTSTAPLYSFAKSYVDMLSNGETKLEKEAVYMGATVGGYAAVALADTFKTYYGIEPIKVLSSSAPLKLRTFPLSLVQKLVPNTLDFADFAMSISMASVFLPYSKTRPGMDNSDKGLSFIKPERTDYFVSMFQDQNALSPNHSFEQFYGYFSATYPDALSDLGLLDPSVVAFFKDAIARNDPDPCKNCSPLVIKRFGMKKLCAALNANDLTELLEEGDLPVEACHSEDDEIVPYDSTTKDIMTHTISGGVGHAYASSHCFPLLIDGVEIEKPKIKENKGSEL